MKKILKNQKGFTLAEEVVTVLLVSILVASASGILINAIRIFSQNVITLTAQEKGIAVMTQLEDNLTYAKQINAVTDTTTFYTSSDVENEPYQINLDVTGEYVTIHSYSAYSSLDPSSGSTVSNRVCKLGDYQVRYTLTPVAGKDEIMVYLEINRHGRTYYSDRRTVVLKNQTVGMDESFYYDSSDTGKYLHIGSLE